MSSPTPSEQIGEKDSAPTDRRMTRVFGWLLALALIVVGLSAAFPASPAVPEFPDWLTRYALLPGVLLLGVVVSARRARSSLYRTPARRFRNWCGSLAVSAVWPTVWAWLLTVENFSGGLPVLAPVLLAIGCSAGMIGATGLAVWGSRVGEDPDAAPPRVVWRRRMTGAVAGAAPLGVAIAIAAILVNTVTLDATTAAITKPPPPPSSPTAAAWDWRAPNGHRVDEVVTAGAGVVVLVDDGVIALDGETGDERWRFRLDGAIANGLGASPDGGTVMVTFVSSIEDAEGTRVIALNAMTGEKTGFDEVTEGGVFGGVKLDMTEHVLIGGDYEYGKGEFEGFDIHTGESRWSWSKPETCRIRTEFDSPEPARDVVMFGLVCGPKKPTGPEVTVTVTLIALDDRTGEERWRFERDVPAEAQQVNSGDRAYWTNPGWNLELELLVSDDGSVVSFGWGDSEGKEPAERFLLDAGSGSILLDSADFPSGKIVAFDRERLITTDTPRKDKPIVYTMTTVGDTAETVAETESTVDGDVVTDETLIGFYPYIRFNGNYRTVLYVTSWDGHDTTKIDIDLGKASGEGVTIDFNIEHAPGAVVVWHHGATKISAVA